LTDEPRPTRAVTPRHVVFYLPNLAGGGAERSILRLSQALAERGHQVELIVNQAAGPYRSLVSASVRLTVLERARKVAGRAALVRLALGNREARAVLARLACARRPIIKLAYIPALAAVLAERRPEVLISALTRANLAALLACRLAELKSRVVVTERNHLSAELAERREQGDNPAGWASLIDLVNACYPWADVVAGVSHGVADDLAASTTLSRDTIRTLYNPVVGPDLAGTGSMPLPAGIWPITTPDTTPVILAVGRLEPQKDFLTLIRAVAELRRTRPVHLVIAGEGVLREALCAEIRRLALDEVVHLVGWVDAPAVLMHRASLFVLSSLYEGLPGVLIEAMGCGCPVVATDCPSGPREILLDGRYGPLVPVADVPALAEAMQASLDHPVAREALLARAGDFSIETSTKRFERLIEDLATR